MLKFLEELGLSGTMTVLTPEKKTEIIKLLKETRFINLIKEYPENKMTKVLTDYGIQLSDIE